MGWETVIGLEVHAQLATQSKIFSTAPTAYGAGPNMQANLVDLGYPGVLPVLNGAVVDMAVRFGLAVGATIAPRSVFARKNYFYPDLPKGYQISQFELPIVTGGAINITLEDGTRKRVQITRAHLEEDAGKSLHEDFHGSTGIDLNRAGTPLLEIVSEPDLRSPAEAVAYLKAMHTLVRYLGICDGNMQEGSFRCDANVSVRNTGSTVLGTRTEIKNLNSFRFIDRAIAYEARRQIEVLEDGGTIVQETRLYDSDRDETRPMRGKEEANDYRYFPDPDLLPVMIDAAHIARIREQLPELPEARRDRFVSQFELSDYDAAVLTASRELADYFEAVVERLGGHAKLAANWVMGDLSGALNRDALGVTESRIEPDRLAALLGRIVDKTVSGKIAKDLFEAIWAGEGDADTLIERRGLRQITDTTALQTIVDECLAASAAQREQYRAGKTQLFGYFVGQVMKATKGKASPEVVNRLLKAALDDDTQS